jgi:hypothetical protein
MTTKLSGELISCRVGLTLEANYAAQVGDLVQGGPGDFQVVKADGTKPVIGWVSKRNVGRGTLAGGNAGSYPVAVIPGDVTVEAFGHGRRDFLVAVAFGVGAAVGANAAGNLAPVGAGVVQIGIALQAGVVGQRADVLIQP